MADFEATEMSYGRGEDLAGYVSSAAAPVVYTRYANHGPKTPSPYDAPPLPPYEPVSPFPPTHFLPPYDYVPQPPPSIPPRGHQVPPSDFHGPVATKPQPRPLRPPHDPPPTHFLPPYDYEPQPPPSIPPRGHQAPPSDFPGPMAAKPQPRGLLPPHAPPVDMVIPGVQHPDGRFEPHPYFARRSAPGPPMEPEEPELPVEPEEPELPSKSTVEVAVPVCCEACKERITNYVGGAPGVDSVDCDVYEQKVTVTGDLPPAEVLQRCRKCFRKAALV